MCEWELIVDSFAGGGGASLGIAQALGRVVDVAINHDAGAIAMHAANHPQTRHFTEDVWKVLPQKVTHGRPVGLLWASPDCKHFSRAKGGKPVEKKIRSLAWVVVKWASEVSPRIIILENVREFEDWGPLVPRWECAACQWRGTEGQAVLGRRGGKACPRCESRRLRQTAEMVPCQVRKGLTFRRFVGRLRNLGYRVEWKVLNAADYGAPTHRRRLFLVARNDGAPIVWPEPTHASPKKIGEPSLFGGPLQPWRIAAECIDWALPCPSIFSRKRPLAEATLRRIAMGVKRYVLDNPRPFLVVCNHGGPEFRGQGLDEPLPTVTAARDAHGLITPVVATLAHGGSGTFGDSRSHSVGEPLRTRISQTGGNGKYVNGADEPLTSLVSKTEHLLVAPTLIQTGYGERPGQSPRVLDLDKPLGSAVAGGQKQALVAAFLAKHFGGVVGVPADTPLPTTTERGTQNQLVAANLIHLNHGDKQWSDCNDPMRTVTTGNHAFLVYSFLTKYFGTAIGQVLDAPLPTATERDRFGLVTVSIGGEAFVIVDIGMRMLTPRELARGQGFPDSYVLTGTNTSQVAKVGNSVCPVMARVLVGANYQPAEAEVCA